MTHMKLFLAPIAFYLSSLSTLVHSCFHLPSKPASSFSGSNIPSMEMEQGQCVPCTEDHSIECFNNGLCCTPEYGDDHCKCPPNYFGLQCEQNYLESSNTTETLTLLSSLFGLLLTIFVFIILILLVLHSYKTNKRRKMAQQKRSQMLEKKMMMIQEDMDKMSPNEKMTRLTRLSKLIEATTRAALITYPGPYVTSPSPFPKKRGLPSISEKTTTNFRRFSEPTILTAKPPPQQLKDNNRKTSVKNDFECREQPFMSI